MSVGTPAASLAGLRVSPERLAALPEEERAVVAAQLAELDEAIKQNPLLRYNHPTLSLPHPKQVRFHSPPWPRTRLFMGGNRSGKSTATHVDTIIQCLDREAVPEHLLPFKRWDPPFYCRIVGVDLTRWLEGIGLQKFREWCPKSALHGGGMARGWEKQQMMLRFKNGSWVQFMSNDQDLEKFAGVALHRVVYDEPPREDIWGECRARLIDYGGEELFGLTPTEGISNWLYDKWYEPWEALSSEGVDDEEIERLLKARIVLVDMDDNPHLSEEDKEWALEGWSELEREARKTGRFISMSGLIYPMFSKGRHVVPDVKEIPAGVECFEGLDPGMRHMAAVVFCYLDFEDRLVVYDELALQGKTVAEVAKQIKLKRAEWGVTPRFTVIDPAARNKSPQTGRSDQQEYMDHGIFTMPGQNDVRPGINRVAERLEADPPRLLVAAGCRELLSEFKKYRWKKDSSRSEDDPRDRPVKKDDHLLDALRYVAMARPLRPEKNPLKPGETMKERILRHHLKRLHPNRRQLDAGFGPGIHN